MGNVQFIGGPDLAAATVEPHEFLDFVSGRLERQFVDSPDALALRLATLDTRPDFDGRYRVNDFFCHDDTWRATLASLVRHSDAVLMDLRGFSPARQGCVYEVRELVETVPLDRLVMTVDATTDTPFLERTLLEAWAAMGTDSPNRQGDHELRLVRLERVDLWGIAHLLRMLCRAAT